MTEKMTEKTEEKKTFADFGLSENSLKAINKKGFEEPTPIQILTILFNDNYF